MDWSPKNTAVSWAGWAIAQPIISLAFLAGLPRERSARGTEPHTHGIDSIRILRQSWDELALIMNECEAHAGTFSPRGQTNQ